MSRGTQKTMEPVNLPMRLEQRARAPEMACIRWEKHAPAGSNRVKVQESAKRLVSLKNEKLNHVHLKKSGKKCSLMDRQGPDHLVFVGQDEEF